MILRQPDGTELDMASAIAEAKRLGEKAKLRVIARAWDVPTSTM